MRKREFERAVKKGNEPALAEAFYWLAGKVYDYMDNKSRLLDRDDMIQEGVLYCYEKLKRYKEIPKEKTKNKNVTFNYFTTTIMSLFRQNTGTSRNYNELKKRYKEYLEQKQSDRLHDE